MSLSTAVASSRALPYVRRVQLAALYNFHDMDGEFLRAVNGMVKNSEKVDANTRSLLEAAEQQRFLT